MVLVDRRTNRLFAYNSSAALVWSALFRTGRVVDAAADLIDAFGISPEQALSDVSTIVEQWRSHGLLSRAQRSKSGSLQDGIGRLRRIPIGSPLSGTYRIGGRVFYIHVADTTVARRIETIFQSHLVVASPPDETIEVLRSDAGHELILKRDGKEVVRTSSFREMTGALFQTILTAIYAEHRWLATIHGGAVSTEGRAVLLAGTSGSGKSTLAAFLIAQGFTYLSDDLIAVTREGRVAPWPVPLSIKKGSWEVLAPYFPELDAVESKPVWDRTVKYLPIPPVTWLQKPNEAAALVFPKFNRSPGDVCLTPLRPMEALQRLISDRIWLGYPLRAQSIKEFLNWLAQMRSYELCYSGFEDVERLVRDAVLQRVHDG